MSNRQIVPHYAYIKRCYRVNPVVGQVITMDGKRGVICRPKGDTQYLRVRFDGERRISNVHPTWEIDYSPPPVAQAQELNDV